MATKQHRTNTGMLQVSKRLRQQMTGTEVKLWQHLRGHRLIGVHFRRQHAIGPYVVDFCAPSRKLIIELDGSQHLDQEEWDLERTKYLEARGYRVIRFWNSNITNQIEVVLDVICEACEM